MLAPLAVAMPKSDQCYMFLYMYGSLSDSKAAASTAMLDRGAVNKSQTN